MKLNYDCARDILKYVEKQDLDTTITFKNIATNLNAYSPKDIYYACIKLNEANFLEVILKSSIGSCRPSILKICDLTYLGHEFLANTGNDNNWSKIKSIAATIGTQSIQGLSQIATSIITQLIKDQFGLI